MGDFNTELLDFIEKSPDSYHAADTAAHMLAQAGFQALREDERWHLQAGGRYYVIRNDSALIALEIPEKCFGGIFARSGLATKQGLRPSNCVGVIDSDYRGEIIVALHNDSDKPQQINFGDRIAQLVLIPYLLSYVQLVDDLSETDRGNGGFGSTGSN